MKPLYGLELMTIKKIEKMTINMLFKSKVY